jgi:hypothetical protein
MDGNSNLGNIIIDGSKEELKPESPENHGKS